MTRQQEVINKIAHSLDLGRGEREIVEEGINSLIQAEADGCKSLAEFAADERDRTILLANLLTEAREYVADALDAMEHSDGRYLLNRIDVALK